VRLKGIEIAVAVQQGAVIHLPEEWRVIGLMTAGMRYLPKPYTL
jgi:hypothetical protein